MHIQRVKELNPSGEYVFVNTQGKRMTTNCFRRRLGRICEKLHIYKKSPHKIRKTYGTILMDNNLEQRLVCEMMGHTNIMCSEQYYHRDMCVQKKKAENNSLPKLMTGIEPVTPSLPRKCSTTEPHQHL